MTTRCRMILIVDVDLDDRPGVYGSDPQHIIDHLRRGALHFGMNATITPKTCFEVPPDGTLGAALPLD